MNVVLDDPYSVPYFTDMKATLEAAEIKPSDFDWYISDLETNFAVKNLPARAGWMIGRELEEVLNTQSLQFIWAVFSAFPKDMRIDIMDDPYAYGNPKYWSDRDLKPTLPGAVFELVSWDSSATLLVGVPDRIAQAFMRKYQQAKLHTAVISASKA